MFKLKSTKKDPTILSRVKYNKRTNEFFVVIQGYLYKLLEPEFKVKVTYSKPKKETQRKYISELYNKGASEKEIFNAKILLDNLPEDWQENKRKHYVKANVRAGWSALKPGLKVRVWINNNTCIVSKIIYK